MFNLRKKIQSERKPEIIINEIQSNFENEIKNSFYISEASVKSGGNPILIEVEVIPLLRRSFSTKYWVSVKNRCNGSSTKISSNTLILRVFFMAIVFATVLYLFPEPMFFSYYFDALMLSVAFSIFITGEIIERKKIFTAIKNIIKNC